MREQVKELWKLCFPDDTDEFVELYFSSKYTDATNSAIMENGRVVSALQRVPYPMWFHDTVIPVSYISGACTHPDYRSKGLMSQLLVEAHRRMFADGKLLSVLIPAGEGLISYYSRFGYEVCFQQERKLLTGMCKAVDNSKSLLTFNELSELKDNFDDVCSFINQQLSTRAASILHPLHDFQTVIADIYLSGGQIWCAHNEDGKLCALSMVVSSDGCVIIKEQLSEDERLESEMLGFILKHYSVSEAVKPSPTGMIRVINVCGILDVMSARTKHRMIIEIYGDEVIPENNGVYIISDDTCRKSHFRPEYDNDTVFQRIHINSMPSWLFGGIQPYMSLMLD